MNRRIANFLGSPKTVGAMCFILAPLTWITAGAGMDLADSQMAWAGLLGGLFFSIIGAYFIDRAARGRPMEAEDLPVGARYMLLDWWFLDDKRKSALLGEDDGTIFVVLYRGELSNKKDVEVEVGHYGELIEVAGAAKVH